MIDNCSIALKQVKNQCRAERRSLAEHQVKPVFYSAADKQRHGGQFQ